MLHGQLHIRPGGAEKRARALRTAACCCVTVSARQLGGRSIVHRKTGPLTNARSLLKRQQQATESFLALAKLISKKVRQAPVCTSLVHQRPARQSRGKERTLLFELRSFSFRLSQCQSNPELPELASGQGRRSSLYEYGTTTVFSGAQQCRSFDLSSQTHIQPPSDFTSCSADELARSGQACAGQAHR